MFSAPTRLDEGARDLSRRNVSTAQTRPQNPKASFAHQHLCGLKSAVRRSRGDEAVPAPFLKAPCQGLKRRNAVFDAQRLACHSPSRNGPHPRKD